MVPVAKRREFLESLSERQRGQLEKAEAWYFQTYHGQDADKARRTFALQAELSELEAKNEAYTAAARSIRERKGDRAAAQAALKANRLSEREKARLAALRKVKRLQDRKPAA
jgi:hypothetical protein